MEMKTALNNEKIKFKLRITFLKFFGEKFLVKLIEIEKLVFENMDKWIIQSVDAQNNIMNEIDKLIVYKGKDKNITYEDIELVITSNLENNIFKLTNMIMEKNTNNIIKVYKDLVRNNEDPIKILITISNQFRLVLQVKLMVKNGFTDNEIISILKEHPYRIKLSKQVAISEKELKENILKLSELNKNIVLGKIEKEFGLEMFLLNL